MIARVVLVLCGVAVAVTSGCSVPRRAGFDDVQKLLGERGVERVHWNQGTKEDAEVEAWVDSLLSRELTPQSAVEIALLNNPRLQATYERLGVAQADVVQAGLLKNPSFSFGIGFPLSSGTGSEYEFSLVEDFLQLFLIPARKRLARAEHETVKLEVAHEVLELQASVRAAVYVVQSAEQVGELRRTLAEAAQASAELTERQHAAGNRSDLDLAVEEGLRVASRLDVLRADDELRSAREQLTRLLGLWGKRAAWRLGGRLPELPPPSQDPPLDDVESFAVAHRLDLRAATSRVERARAAIPLARAGVIGGLELGAQGHQLPEHGGRVLGPELHLEIPIFDQRQATLFKLRAELRAAERALDALKVEALSQVRAARDHLVASRTIADYYRQTVLPLRERAVELSQQQYNAMLLGVFQLLSTKEIEVRSYREYIEAVRDYWIARAELERASGGPIVATKGSK